MKFHRTNLKKEDNNKIFFTADPHFGHKLMADLRNFNSIDEMDLHLIDQWNKTVPKDGKVFMLGDFTWYRTESEINCLFTLLNGDIHLIRGNHDESLTEERIKSNRNAKSIQVYSELIVQVDGDPYTIILSHFPFEIWDKKHYGSIHLHGHCHARHPDNERLRRMDVGVDANKEFRPFSFSEIVEVMARVDFETFTDHD